MILSYFFFWMLAILAFLDNYTNVVRDAYRESGHLAVELLELGIVLAILGYQGWRSGLVAACFLLAAIIITKPLSKRARKANRSRGG